MLFRKSSVHELQHLLEEYVQTLSSPFDSFLEEHILSSEFHVILDRANEIGYYAVHQGRLLTQFYIRPSYLKFAQELFARVIEQHNVESLFVPTCDELFISLAVDKGYPIHKQAYFFRDSHADLPDPESPKSDRFGPATLDDLASIREMCGDFLNHYEERITNGQLFTYYRNSALLGIGVLEKSQLLKGLASIGMFTKDEYRRQGIGRSMIIRLRKWCYSHQLEPICGCWYYNEASKRTLESAGMVTRTRLLNLQVTTSEPHP